MKSIKKKLIAAILVCSLFTAVLIGVLAISNSMNTADGAKKGSGN